RRAGLGILKPQGGKGCEERKLRKEFCQSPGRKQNREPRKLDEKMRDSVLWVIATGNSQQC
ncbi:hypothetical protein ACQP3L_35190, partial [Escherichia coli]